MFDLTGDSAIEFASGQITSLAAGAQLHLNGNDAFIEDSTALGSNSALTGLASIGAGATFDLENKAAVSTTGALVNDGNVYLDANGGDGGSSLTVAGTLTNSGTLDIGNRSLSSSDSVTAKSFVNSGTVDLTGNGTNLAALDVSGTTTNNGSISIGSDTEELAGAVGGTGSFSLSTPIFGSTRASRPGRPSTRPARTRSRSSRRSTSPPRSPVSEPATRSTRRTFSRRRRRTISSRIRWGPAAR